MSTISTLRTALLAWPGLTALVGVDGVFIDSAPGSRPLPYVILRQIGENPERGLDGSLHARQEIFHAESWGTTRESSNTIHRQVEAALVAQGDAPEAADPDGLDPDVGARACVWVVDIWST